MAGKARGVATTIGAVVAANTTMTSVVTTVMMAVEGISECINGFRGKTSLIAMLYCVGFGKEHWGYIWRRSLSLDHYVRL